MNTRTINSNNRAVNTELSIKILLFFIGLFAITNFVNAQTKGLIVEPATAAGTAVLDPNGDGYVSGSTAGFSANDSAESEIPYVPFVFLGLEPTSDINNGPDCGFTDFVETGAFDPAYSYVDGSGNWLFRLRLGDIRSNAKSYSILVDTDGKFGNSGPNADADYTLENPGFEVEVVLGTKFGVYVYNVDGTPNCIPVVEYLGADHYQKAIAISEECGDPDYFLDFYVESSDLSGLGITSSTPIRMVIVDNMAAKKSTICNPSSASDVAGVPMCPSLADCYEEIIDNQGPCSLADINAGNCLPKSVCPTITAPIDAGDNVVSGTTSEADGTTIGVYKNNSLIGTTTSSGGAWSLTGISPVLASNDIINATAQASGETVSVFDCNTTTVGAICSAPPISAFHCGKSISGQAPVTGAVINVYFNSSATPITPTSGTVWSPGQITASGTDHGGGNPGDNFLWKCVGSGESAQCNASGPACLGDGVYRITATEPGKCESTPIYVCINTTGDTATPIISTSPITTGTTSVSGTMPSPDNIATDIGVILYINDVQVGTTTTTAGGAWTIGSLTLNACDVITAKAIRTGSTPKCISNASTAFNVLGGTTGTPQISGTYCTIGAITTVNGISGEADGTTISVFENGVLEGTTTVSSGAWTLSGIMISAGSTITATATASGSCKTESPISTGVVVGSQSTNAVAITTDPIIEQTTTISGTGTSGDVITLYVDDFQVEGASATVSGGIWTISGLPTYELYTGGVVTVKATSPGSCESAPSASKTVICIPPIDSLTVNPDNAVVCSGSFVANIEVNSENLVIYQLYLDDETTTTGSSVLGNGSTITMTSGILTSSTTLKVKALKLSPGSCEVFLTDNVPVTVNATPDLGLTVNSTSPVCSGTSANISVVASETGVSYQLRNDADDSNVGAAVIGDGNTIILPTGNLTSDTTFNILATGVAPSSCSGELTNKVTVTTDGICNSDNDGDGIPDEDDLDDDNDGILDQDELGDIVDGYQPPCGGDTLDFSGPYTEESGDGNIATFLVGEVFRFPNVKTGVDALITIQGAVNAAIQQLDENVTDASAFKPQTNFTLTNVGDQAYIEYNIAFVNSGGTTPEIIDEFFVNFNDIDGTTDYSEENWSENASNVILDDPTEITISNLGNWLIGTGGTTTYPGVQNTNPQVNYATQHLDKDNYTIRVGAVARTAGAAASPRLHMIEFSCLSNWVSVQTYLADFDEDGIPNHLDLDSDNDGCFDALEGDAGILLSQLNVDGSINNPVNDNGIPVGPGTAGAGTTGQADVSSQNISVEGSECLADLSLTKTVDNATPRIGDTIVFTITLTNDGPRDTTGVQVKDLLPTGLNYDIDNSVIPASTSYDDATGIWDLSSLTIANGNTIVIQIAGIVTPACGEITNSAEIISSNKLDPDSIINNQQ